MLEKIDHIGVAVAKIDAKVEFWQNLLALGEVKQEEVSSQKVKVAFLPIGESKVELLEPLDETSPIAKFLDSKGEGVHHLAFRVQNIEQELQKLKKNGAILIDEIPRLGAGSTKVAFVHPKSTGGVLIELCEKI